MFGGSHSLVERILKFPHLYLGVAHMDGLQMVSENIFRILMIVLVSAHEIYKRRGVRLELILFVHDALSSLLTKCTTSKNKPVESV